MKPVVVAYATLLIALLCAAPTHAQDGQVVAPPGNSGVEEYLEIVPGAAGDRPVGGSGQATTPNDAGSKRATPREVLDARTTRELRSLGPDGRAAADLAAAGAPPVFSNASGANAKDKAERRSRSNKSSESVASDTSGGRAEAVVGALAGNGGMGLAFPLLLLGALAAAVGLLAVRRIARHE